jgi:hypothetical protein
LGTIPPASYSSTFSGFHMVVDAGTPEAGCKHPRHHSARRFLRPHLLCPGSRLHGECPPDRLRIGQW